MFWDPFRLTTPLLPVLRLAEGLDRPRSRLALETAGGPALDVFADEQGLTLVVALPGLAADQVELSLEEDRLVLSGSTSEAPAGRALHRERPAGRFSRTVHLPHRVEAGEVEARFERGLLVVKLPRARADRPVHIPVQGAGPAPGETSHE